jgi:branched-chain amino acid transport system permease protein
VFRTEWNQYVLGDHRELRKRDGTDACREFLHRSGCGCSNESGCAGGGSAVGMAFLPAFMRTRAFAGCVVVAIVVGVSIESWSGQPFTFAAFLSFAITGITLGSIYAISATGLVVTYTTSGVFNFAQGAMGTFLTYIYWQLTSEWGMPTLMALLLVVLVIAPVLGAAIDILLMRTLRDAPLVSIMVVTIGLMIFFIGITTQIWNPNTTRSITTFFGTSGFHLGATFLPWYRVITIGTGIVLALGLRVLLYRTRIGIAMRAVVDNRELAAHNGARPWVMSMTAWSLGASMAALAGIFLSEELSSLVPSSLTLLIIDSFAAAIIGRLRNFPMTYVGGMVIGFAVAFEISFLQWDGRWSSAGASGAAIPTIVLFLALMFLPQARIEGRKLTRKVVPRVISLRRAAFGFGLLMVVVVVLCGLLDRTDVRFIGLAAVSALLMVSLIPLTGWSGQISLAQITFAGIGAWAVWEFSSAGGAMFGLKLFPAGSPWLLLVGAIVAVPFGVLVALPAIRLQGLYLALATLAFARLAEFIFFDQPEVFGANARPMADLHLFGADVAHPFSIFGLTFPADGGTVIVATATLCVLGFCIVLLRRSRYGRRLIAMRDSPTACATLGMNLSTTKLSVFALSAAIAGFAGGFIGLLAGTVSTTDFQVLGGLQYVILAVVGGVGVVGGVMFGAGILQSFPLLVAHFPESQLFLWLEQVGPGLLGIGIGRNPEGVVPGVSSQLRTKAEDSKIHDSTDVDNGGAGSDSDVKPSVEHSAAASGQG